jgi:CHASE2 domain-containing sensor protein
MKAITTMNYYMMSIPLALMATGWAFHNLLWVAGCLITILTGGFQVIFGIGLLIDSNGKNKSAVVYLLLVAAFFTLLMATNWQWIWIMPPLLALYFTAIVVAMEREERKKKAQLMFHYFLKA